MIPRRIGPWRAWWIRHVGARCPRCGRWRQSFQRPRHDATWVCLDCFAQLAGAAQDNGGAAPAPASPP